MLEGSSGTDQWGLPPSHHRGFGGDSVRRTQCVKAELLQSPCPDSASLVPVALQLPPAPKTSASRSLMQGIFLG